MRISQHAVERYQQRVDANETAPLAALCELLNASRVSSIPECAVFAVRPGEGYHFRTAHLPDGRIVMLVIKGDALVTVLKPRPPVTKKQKRRERAKMERAREWKRAWWR